jgi:hypothetical protein
MANQKKLLDCASEYDRIANSAQMFLYKQKIAYAGQVIKMTFFAFSVIIS